MHIFHNDTPTVQVFSLDHHVTSKVIFTDKLHETQLNSNRAHKNWCKRRAAWRRRARAEARRDYLECKPWDNGKGPQYERWFNGGVGDKVYDPRA